MASCASTFHEARNDMAFRSPSHGHLLVAVLAFALAMPAHSVAHAEATGARKVYEAPQGFWLRPTDKRKKLYGPSTPAANWAIAQWGTLSDLPAFNNGATADSDHSATINPDGSYNLKVDTMAQPCQTTYPSGRRLVKETDIFASPNNARTAKGFPSASVNDQEPLSRISKILHRIRVRPQLAAFDSGPCQVSQAVFITAVVLMNPKAKQVLYYQLRLLTVTHETAPHAVAPPPGWFFTGQNIQQRQGNGQYGYGDNVASFGQEPAPQGQWTTFDVDLYPRLIQLIAEGAKYGMAQDLSDWMLTGTYHGIAAMGDIQASAQWDGFSLRVD